MTHLQEILIYATRVTARGVKKLQKELPRVKIEPIPGK